MGAPHLHWIHQIQGTGQAGVPSRPRSPCPTPPFQPIGILLPSWPATNQRSRNQRKHPGFSNLSDVSEINRNTSTKQ
ncbi:hypothetical protein CRUP_004764, partial [Coryphaenoides rupestris]